MTDQSDRSRRDFVASAVTIAAIAGAAGDAQAQTPSNLRFSNPPGMSKPPSYSHVVEVNGTTGALWWNMEDMNRLHVFYGADEAAGVGGFRDIMVTQPDHPSLKSWWPPGHIVGWEHGFTHEWHDFAGAVIDGRPLSAQQATFEDGYEAAVLSDAILASAAEGRRVTLGEMRTMAFL